MATQNEAAERLRHTIGQKIGLAEPLWVPDLDAALAAERRATVERLPHIITAIGVEMPWLLDRAVGRPNEGLVLAAEIAKRLDEEAAR